MCHAIKGKKVFTFSNTAEATKFPCKYNAIKSLTCGKWKITLSPGNALDSHRNKKYILRTMYVVVENVNTQLTWEGRSDLKIAKKVCFSLSVCLSVSVSLCLSVSLSGKVEAI